MNVPMAITAVLSVSDEYEVRGPPGFGPSFGPRKVVVDRIEAETAREAAMKFLDEHWGSDYLDQIEELVEGELPEGGSVFVFYAGGSYGELV